MRSLTSAEIFLISGGDGSTVITLSGPVVTPSPSPGPSPVGDPGNPGSSGGGGNGGTPTTTGTHNVYERDFTSKTPGFNNPGDIRSNSWTAAHGATGSLNGFAEFATEQDGRQVLGDLIDANYNGYNDGNFAQKFSAGDSQGIVSETQNVDSYMASHGYGTNDAISTMSNDEFNVFLDAITNAEGRTNM